jgi:DNA-binding LacI/PurR family transcriptional regulator
VNFGYVFLAAYKDVMARHGVVFDPELVFVTRRNEAAGYKAMEQMLDLDEPPTAVLLIYEVTAIGVYRRLRDSGLEPGRDIAVVGFRDEPTTRFLTPTLTCFKISLTELGVSVGRALMAQIPRFQSQFPDGLVQARHPLSLQAGESDSCSPPPDRRSAISDKRFG